MPISKFYRDSEALQSNCCIWFGFLWVQVSYEDKTKRTWLWYNPPPPPPPPPPSPVKFKWKSVSHVIFVIYRMWAFASWEIRSEQEFPIGELWLFIAEYITGPRESKASIRLKAILIRLPTIQISFLALKTKIWRGTYFWTITAWPSPRHEVYSESKLSFWYIECGLLPAEKPNLNNWQLRSWNVAEVAEDFPLGSLWTTWAPLCADT